MISNVQVNQQRGEYCMIIRYPIGAFVPIQIQSVDQRIQFINLVSSHTFTLRSSIKALNSDQLRVPYRNGGWNIQQIIHHMADNDMNAYLRFKRALTEHEPSAQSYREDMWAELNDYSDVPIETSILLLESLHSRFMVLLLGLPSDVFQRTLRTQALGVISLDIALQRFNWHNQHHISQIKALVDVMGW